MGFHRPQDELKLRVIDPFELVSNAVWLLGVYGTDASGGKFGRYPELRRCGCGAVQFRQTERNGLGSHQLQLQFAASFNLQGPIQTIRLAELFAIYQVVMSVAVGPFTIASDSEVNELMSISLGLAPRLPWLPVIAICLKRLSSDSVAKIGFET